MSSCRITYQSSHRAVQRMPVIPPELWVCAFKGRVAMGFRFLDTTQGIFYQYLWLPR